MTRLLATLTLMATAWSLSSFGYFWVTPILGATLGYNDAPWFFSGYYLLWALLTFGAFYPAYREGTKFDTLSSDLMIAAVMMVCFVAYALLVIPRLPQTVWLREETPVEFFWANAAYFLPKSFEILFQQLLIAALILALNAQKLSLKSISLTVALLFGSFHLTLALSYPNPVYVIRYSIAATIFGAIAPSLILRLRHGFLISYGIHWAYYAVDIALVHFFFAER